MWLVIGLGNPGRRYSETRHNVGFQVASRLGVRHAFGHPRTQHDSEVLQGDLRGERVIIAMPQLFMNRSGYPVECLRGWNKVALDHLIVVHDDMDLPFGQVRVKEGGGHGGHNGLRDIAAHSGPEHLRVRVGISRPPAAWDPAEYVLSSWTEQERPGLESVLDTACDAVESLVIDGPLAAMNRFNVRPRRSRTNQPDSEGGETRQTSAERPPRVSRSLNVRVEEPKTP